MAGSGANSKAWLASLAALLIAVFLVLGAVWYGVSTEVHQRLWRHIVDRFGGPMTFRVILQPTMAAIAAFYDGMKDARAGRSPYLWTLLTRPERRGGRLREGLLATGRIILLGLCMDVIYQLSVLKTFYPGEAAVIAILLAFVPYVLLRGPFARIGRWWLTHKSARAAP